MGHDKLRKFAENETFRCLIQPSMDEILADGFFNLHDHSMKGHWRSEMFGLPEDAPLVLELGCGKGEYTLDLARRTPGAGFIGVDIKGARLWKGAKTATNEPVPNVAFLRIRIELLTAMFAPGEIDEIWLTFSDPQMKSENSRLSSPVFLERYRQILKPGGVLHLKTDSQFLHEYTKAVASANGFDVLACSNDIYGRDASLPLAPVVREVKTFYEKMFLEMGLPITYMAMKIDREGACVHPEDFDEKNWRQAEGNRRSFGHGASCE